jgi:hypothetical protein
VAESFAALYDNWFDARFEERESIEMYLTRTYRRAWVAGDDSDRFAVLSFVFRRRDKGGYILIIDALRSGNLTLAKHAAAILYSLVGDFADMKEVVLDALGEFKRRHPSWLQVAEAIERRLRQDKISGGDS